MALFTNFTILLVLACISHQLMLSSCQKSQRRRGRVERQQPRLRGKMVTKDKSNCTWAATGEDLFTLNVTCKKEDWSFSCDYVARPALCPHYASNVRLYWKQIARALKRHTNLCQDSNALITATMCRRYVSTSSFRLHNAPRTTALPSTARPEPRAVKSCQPDNKKLADEYCNNSWSSFCTLFFTMVQDGDC